MYVRSLLVFLRHWACGGALVLLSLTGHAGTLTPIKGGETFTLTKAGDGAYKLSSVTAGGVPASRAITAGTVMLGAGAVNVLDTFTTPGPAANLALQLKRDVDWDHVALAGAAGLLATKSPWGAGASAAYDLWQQVRAKPDGQGGALRDVGTEPPMQGRMSYCLPDGVTCYLSPTDALAPSRAQFCATNPCNVGAGNGTVYWEKCGPQCGPGTAPLVVDPGVAGAQWSATQAMVCRPVANPLTNCGWATYGISGTTKVTNSPTGDCPAVTDMSGTIPAGPPGLDGRCPTGRYTAASQAEIAALLNSTSVKDAAQARASDLVTDAVANGVSVVPQSQTLSGPSTQQGQPVTTTTTNSQGDSITKTQDQFFNYSYSNGDTITYTITNQTTTTNNTTNNTTTETTTGVTATGDVCKDHPNASGCVELGDPPDVEKPTKDIPISYTERAFGGAAGCPAPYTYSIDISAAGYHKLGELSFQPLCDALAYLRPITLMAAAVTAFFILIGGLKA